MHPDKYRWLVAAASILIELSIGSMYIWSVFKGPLLDHFHWDPVALSMTFSILLVAYFSLSVVWGRIQDAVGPRWVATIGGIVYCLSFILASKTTSLPYFYLTFGVVGAIGVAACYVCPLSACLKWFPDKRGLVSGLIVAGYGLGSMAFSGIAAGLIDRFGILDSFVILGAVFGVTIVACAQVLRNPPEGYVPAGWKPASGKLKTSGAEFAWHQMVRSPMFWLMVVAYFFGANVGMMTVTNLVAIATSHGMGMAGAILAVSLFSLCNAAGRIGFGLASDRWGRLPLLKGVYGIEVLALLSLFVISGNATVLPLCCIGLAWGGIASIYPAVTADYFGVRNVGTNYGLVLCILGLGLMTSPTLYDLLKRPSAVMDPLLFCSLLVAAGLGLLFFLHQPKPVR